MNIYFNGNNAKLYLALELWFMTAVSCT